MPIVKVLKEAEGGVNPQDKRGRTPLIGASREGQIKVVEYFRDIEADLDAQNEVCMHCIHSRLDWQYGNLDGKTNNSSTRGQASKHGHLDVVKCLTKAGANVNLQSKVRVYLLLELARIHGIDGGM